MLFNGKRFLLVDAAMVLAYEHARNGKHHGEEYSFPSNDYVVSDVNVELLAATSRIYLSMS